MDSRYRSDEQTDMIVEIEMKIGIEVLNQWLRIADLLFSTLNFPLFNLLLSSWVLSQAQKKEQQ